MRILVLSGGSSSEREVSLRSGASVANALSQAGHQTELFDPSEQELTDELARRFDVAFPIIHGRGGEDGTLQDQLESIGLVYVGSGVAASELCFDKRRWRELMARHDVPIAEGIVVTSDTLRQQSLAQKPFVLKPFGGGSSIDTFILRDPAAAPRQAIAEAFGRHTELLLEQLIDGIEITVGVVGETALPVIEIVPPSNGEFDYQNKYNGQSAELCPPEHITAHTQYQAQQLAARIHNLCSCRDLSRTDMIVGGNGALTVLETNTLPGMTNESLLPKAAGVAGMTMPELCDRLVQLAVMRRADAA